MRILGIDPGVATVGELDLFACLRDKASAGTGVLLDARLPEWFAKGSIPGAVNVPFATLANWIGDVAPTAK